MKTFLLFSILCFHAFADSGEYEVPVDSPELLEHSKFKMENITVIQNDKITSLSFVLPKELTGIELTPTTFVGRVKEGEDLSLEGAFGTVICDSEKISEKTSCLVGYNDSYKEYLEILDPKIEQAMKLNTTNLEQLKIRKNIWESFSGEPLGFIFFKDLSKDSIL